MPCLSTLLQPLSRALAKSVLKRSRLVLALALGLCLSEPLFAPAPANACFFWQACARRRGSASNTRGGGKRTSRLRGGNNPALPYVISPRNTWINPQNLPSTIHWHAVEGTHQYRIRIWQWTYERDALDFPIWETVATNNTDAVPFPDLTLEPGIYYSIEVITDAGISSHQGAGCYHAGFQLIFEEDYPVLSRRLAQVNDGVTDPDAVRLAEAGVYFLDEMYADALEILRPLVNSSLATELVYTALGDVYSQTGLNNLAIETYEQALAFVDISSDSGLLSEAIVQVSLADAYATSGDFLTAGLLLGRAVNTYQQLGNEVEVDNLNNRIEALTAYALSIEQRDPSTNAPRRCR